MNEVYICRVSEGEKISFEEFESFIKVMSFAKKTVSSVILENKDKRFQCIKFEDIVECGLLIAFSPVDIEDDTWDKMVEVALKYGAEHFKVEKDDGWDVESKVEKDGWQQDNPDEGEGSPLFIPD